MFGTQPGECNILNFTDVGNSSSYSYQHPQLVQGETYFVSIIAKNRAGLISDVISSTGVAVDKTGTFVNDLGTLTIIISKCRFFLPTALHFFNVAC